MVLAATASLITTPIPEIVPTAPCENPPAVNPIPPALLGLYGGNNGPTSDSIPGGIASTSPPTPPVAVYASAAAPQIAASTWSAVFAPVGNVGPAVAAAPNAEPVAPSVSRAYSFASDSITMSMI